MPVFSPNWEKVLLELWALLETKLINELLKDFAVKHFVPAYETGGDNFQPAGVLISQLFSNLLTSLFGSRLSPGHQKNLSLSFNVSIMLTKNAVKLSDEYILFLFMF